MMSCFGSQLVMCSVCSFLVSTTLQKTATAPAVAILTQGLVFGEPFSIQFSSLCYCPTALSITPAAFLGRWNLRYTSQGCSPPSAEPGNAPTAFSTATTQSAMSLQTSLNTFAKTWACHYTQPYMHHNCIVTTQPVINMAYFT